VSCGRELTEFERQHGYSPCPLFLGGPGCDVDVAAIRAAGGMTVCAGTIEECRGFKNELRFRGRLIPGHPATRALLAELGSPEVTFED
jgi:hypothetical protein